MAATFVVEDGTGKSDANAYISTAWADQYWEDHDDSGFTTAWAGLTSAEKEMAIRMATQYLDTVYRKRWKGIKKLSTQALDHPRSELYDENDYIQGNDIVVPPLQAATAEAAIRHVNEADGLLPDLEEEGRAKSYSIRVGPISESTSWVAGRSEYKRFSIVDQLLVGILKRTGTILRA